MLITETPYKNYFADFEVENILCEPTINYGLFEEELKDSQAEQIKVFSKIEHGLPMYNAASFGSQVHFQNAYQTPVQRWFPYREGYSTRLVNAFLKELQITGNVFDPFSGSGTTLLASRQNDLNSFGVDVNPISVLVARVENEKYSKDDVENLKQEIVGLSTILASSKKLNTAFELAEKVFNEEILQSLLQLKVHLKQIQNLKIQNLFFVAWLSIIEEVSNIKKEGNGIKYKNRKRTPTGYINIEKEVWEKQVFPDDKFNFVRNKLLRHLNIILKDINENFGVNEKKPKIFQGKLLEFRQFFFG